MKRIFCFLSSFLFLAIYFCFSYEADDLLQPYFEYSELSDEAALDNYYKCKDTYLSNKTEENTLNYINSCRVLSCYYAGGALLKKGRLVQGLQSEVEELVDFNKAGCDVHIAYGDFLFSHFFWKKDNQDIIQKYPNVCRRALIKEPGNKEAKLKYALWAIFPANSKTNNWNTFIKECESSIENLTPYDRFNAYIQYSAFYMKNYNTEKGFFYLHKAKELYPDNVLCAVLETNYKKGNLGL